MKETCTNGGVVYKYNKYNTCPQYNFLRRPSRPLSAQNFHHKKSMKNNKKLTY